MSLREQIQALVGEIKLAPTTDGYLEAVMPPPFEGLLKLVNGSQNAGGCGGPLPHFFTPPRRFLVWLPK